MDNEELIILPESLLEEQIQIPKTLAAVNASCSPSACEYIGQGPCGQMCDPSCQDNMCGGCQTVCNSCEGSSCQTCQTACQSSCQTTCERYCETDCEYCETACQLSCQTGCQVSCQTGCEVSCQTGCQVSCQCSVQGGQGTPPSYSVSAGINSITFSYTNGTVDYNYNYWTVYVVEGSTQIYKEWVSASTRTHTVTGLSAGTTYTVNVGYTNSYGAGDVGKIGSRTITTDIPDPSFVPATIQFTKQASTCTAEFPAFLYDASPSYSGNMYMKVVINSHDYGYFNGTWGGSTVVFDAFVSGLSYNTTYSARLEVYDKNHAYTGLWANITFITPTPPPPPQYEMRIATYIDGVQYSFVTHTQNEFSGMSISDWLTYFKTSFGLQIPDGYYEYSIVDNDPVNPRPLNYMVDLYSNHVIIAYYKSHMEKAYIYDNNKWNVAKAYIYDGSKWVEVEPNIFDNGWN